MNFTRKLYTGLVFLYLFCSNSFIFAQGIPPNMHFRNLTTKEGLPNNEVMSIMQDSQGFIWIGTADGLVRYDGHGYKKYKHDPNNKLSITNGSIYALAEDGGNNIWMGTENGGVSVIYRQNDSVKTYKQNTAEEFSLTSNDIPCIIRDDNGKIWIGSWGQGLFKFLGNDRFNNFHDPDSFYSSILTMCKGSKNHLWVGSQGGLASFDCDKEKFSFYPETSISLASKAVWAVCEDANGTVWAGTWGEGLYALNPATGKVKHYAANPDDHKALSDNIVLSILEDRDGDIWIGTNTGGLNVYDKTTDSFRSFEPDPKSEHSIVSGPITVLFEDESGLIWIGTNGGGVSILNKRASQFNVIKCNNSQGNTLTNNDVISVFKDSREFLWIGTHGGGVNKLNTLQNQFTYHLQNSESKKATGESVVYSIYEDRNNNMWLGTMSGLFKYDKDGLIIKKYFRKSVSNISSGLGDIRIWGGICEDKAGNMWIGTLGGVTKFSRKGEFKWYSGMTQEESGAFTIINNKLSLDTRITGSLIDRDNNYWVNTWGNGMALYDNDKDTFRFIQRNASDPFALSNNAMTDIYQDERGIIWVGTQGGGINALFHPEGRTKNLSRKAPLFISFTEQDGIINNRVQSILSDDKGNIWFGTSQGLGQLILPANLNFEGMQDTVLLKYIKENTVIKSYNTFDGLSSDQFNRSACYKDEEGFLYFGTTGGLVYFKPEEISNNPYVPPVVITSFKVFEKDFELDSNIVLIKQVQLSYNENFFSFEFAGLDYTSPGDNQYAYKLEGFDKDWIYSERRKYASYTNIDPGTYTFRVKASNNKGIWNEQGKAIKIIITPPFWKTKWFYFLCIISFILGAIGYIKWRERNLRTENIVLEKKVRARTSELRQTYLELENQRDQLAVKNHEIEDQNIELSVKNRAITDSIDYAKRLQDASLTPVSHLNKIFDEHFIFYRPKDIVSGDFYWAFLTESNKLIWIVADCTGHGVPGAYLSLIGISLLNKIVIENKEEQVLTIMEKLNDGVRKTLKQDANDTKDGINLGLCCWDKNSNILEFSGAYHTLYFVRSGELTEYKGVKRSMGYNIPGLKTHFQIHSIKIQKGDQFYAFSDGFCDQRGGELGKKYYYGPFRDLLLRIHLLPMEEQQKILGEEITKWQGNYPQIDDVLIMGVRI